MAASVAPVVLASRCAKLMLRMVVRTRVHPATGRGGAGSGAAIAGDTADRGVAAEGSVACVVAGAAADAAAGAARSFDFTAGLLLENTLVRSRGIGDFFGSFDRMGSIGTNT